MSHMENAHIITPYTSGVTQALSGQRLATICYKGTTKKDGTKVPALPNKAVSLPQIPETSVRSHLDQLMPHITALLYRAQDAIIRERIADNATHVTDAEISVIACINWMEQESEGGRLTKVVIGNWFDEVMLEALTVRIADKLGISDTPTFSETSKVDALVSSYRDKMCALAGGKTSYPPKLAKSLCDAIAVVESTDEITQKLSARLVKMRDAEQVELIDLL